MPYVVRLSVAGSYSQTSVAAKPALVRPGVRTKSVFAVAVQPAMPGVETILHPHLQQPKRSCLPNMEVLFSPRKEPCRLSMLTDLHQACFISLNSRTFFRPVNSLLEEYKTQADH